MTIEEITTTAFPKGPIPEAFGVVDGEPTKVEDFSEQLATIICDDDVITICTYRRVILSIDDIRHGSAERVEQQSFKFKREAISHGGKFLTFNPFAVNPRLLRP